MLTTDSIDLNKEFYKIAKKLDDEAIGYLKKRGQRDFKRIYINNANETNAIGQAAYYILKNDGSSQDFGNLFIMYKEGEGIPRIKDLTLESQYINFYELYADKYPQYFHDHVYRYAVKTMSEWDKPIKTRQNY